MRKPVTLLVGLVVLITACTRSASTPTEITPYTIPPTPNIEATAKELAVGYVEATIAALPTDMPAPTATQARPTTTPTPLPYTDVPWWAKESISWCLTQDFCEPESGTRFGASNIFRLDQLLPLIQRVLYPDEELADIAHTFQDVSPGNNLTVEDVQRIELLYRRGRIEPCQRESQSTKPRLCGERTQRLYTAEAFVIAGGWEVSEAIENLVCEDVLPIHPFAPSFKVFMDKGFTNPGTRPPGVCLPWEGTTKLMVMEWLYHFQQLIDSGQVEY